MINVLKKAVPKKRSKFSHLTTTNIYLWLFPLILIMCIANVATAAATAPTSSSLKITRKPFLLKLTTTTMNTNTTVVSEPIREFSVAAIKTSNNASSYLDLPIVRRLRKRHSKRHSNWFDYNNFNENSTILEWVNPCGGYYLPPKDPLAVTAWKRQIPNKMYNILKRTAKNELNTLRGSQVDINITDIHIWQLHNYAYKFLPKLKINSTIALKRWYRNMQTYVASFAYLRRVQLKWDHAKSQHESAAARELKNLLMSSRALLCELETAINGTRSNRNTKFENFSRAQMEKRLKLRSKAFVEQNPKEIREADPIDLKFVKFHYYEFLDTMWKVLGRVKRKVKLQTNQQNMAQIDFNEVNKLTTSTTRRSRVGKIGRSRRRKLVRLHKRKHIHNHNNNNKSNKKSDIKYFSSMT